MHANEQIVKPEYDILQKWYAFTIENFAVKPNLIVYLRAEPLTVYERIKKWGRSEESNINFDYINGIHTLHEKWLMLKEFDDAPVLILDANKSPREVEQKFEKSKYASLLHSGKLE